METTFQARILDRIRRHGRGHVFTTKDFLSIGSRETVDQTLSRLAKAGVVRRLARGLYDYPRINKRLGISISPDVAEIAEAMARQTGSRIAPSGATAANRLGLSTQVPAKPVYLTDGRSRELRVGEYVIVVKHVAPKELPGGARTSALVLQALRHLGQDAVDAAVLSKIRNALLPKQRTRLLTDTRYTTDWIAAAVRKIVSGEIDEVPHG